VLSSGSAAPSIGAKRYLVNAIDPLAIGSFRFGIGLGYDFFFWAPGAGEWCCMRPRGAKWPALTVSACLYITWSDPVKASLIFTPPPRRDGALDLAAADLMVAAALGSEALTARRVSAC